MIPSGQEAPPGQRSREISAAGYRQLAEFRYRIRQFLHLSEEAARSKGIEPQQHQVLLAIKGLPGGSRPTVRMLSERLCLRHHSTVDLIDRLVEQGAVARRHCELDRREVLIELTPHGEATTASALYSALAGVESVRSCSLRIAFDRVGSLRQGGGEGVSMGQQTQVSQTA